MSNKQNINQSINYQPGSVVSKEIINKSGGTITLFAFDKGQGLSEHTAPFDALVVVVEGSVEIKISNEKHLVKGGEMLILPANKPHEVKAIEQFKMILTMIKS